MIPSPRVVVAGNDDFVARGATEIAAHLRSTLSGRASAFVALAGGSTPRSIYRALASSRFGLTSSEWRRVHFFWSDERLVDPGDERSNVGAAFEDLLRSLDLPAENIHAPSIVSAAVTAARYERTIREVLPAGPNGTPQFDLILLGLGTDGHTASLFPDQLESARSRSNPDPRLVLAARSPEPPRDRITFSFELIEAASVILFLVSGAGKADVVRRVLEVGERSLPATRVEARRGVVIWLLDRAAASGRAGSRSGC